MPTNLPPPEVDPAEVIGPGLHVNDAPRDDPTRLLVHYDGHIWPWMLLVSLIAGAIGFVVGMRFGTEYYTISTVCTPRETDR